MLKAIPNMSASRLSVKLLEGALLLAVMLDDYEGSETFKVKEQAWNKWKESHPDLVAQVHKLQDKSFNHAVLLGSPIFIGKGE